MTDEPPTQPTAGADPTVLAELVDALIRERIHGFADGTVDGDWYRVGDVRFRIRAGGGLQPWRYAGGPVLIGDHGTTDPDALLRAVACTDPAAVQVAEDLRTAAAHAAVPARAGDPESVAAQRGRPFHPTARAVVGWTVDELTSYGRGTFGLDWLAVRTEALRFGSGDWNTDTVPDMPTDARPGETLVPVHPWQLDHVLATEFAADVDSGIVRVHRRDTGRWRATSSIRTLAPDEGGSSRHLKLPLGVNTLGSQRLLPPRYLDNGERGERLLRTVVEQDPNLADLVLVADETTWCGWNGDPADPADPYADRPGHLAAQVRSYPPGADRAVPMAALAAVDWHTAYPVDPVPFFRTLSGDFCAMAVGFLAHGILPEVHGQNVLRAGRRFVLRDHDTVRYCPTQLSTPDPQYRVKPGARQSLRIDAPAELTGYLQTLGFQVNLYGIIDALTRAHGVSERLLWTALREALEVALDRYAPANSARPCSTRPPGRTAASSPRCWPGAGRRASACPPTPDRSRIRCGRPAPPGPRPRPRGMRRGAGCSTPTSARTASTTSERERSS
ncbi:IucA/IucC family protein [Saccharomonospora sp. CUA-673]|uniref:IucA/IucC family protein n=1 Tax=Saccharomonospora sp. CUA-673 TaxID=1904969 RepID=UPI0011152AED|nr:IucA/IucC family protein [Saccharomonospora sp. CUA-673]